MEDYKKKYEQAMLRMNKWVEGSEITDPKEVAEFIFPELKESEKIKRTLINFLDDVWHLGKDANFDKYGKADCAEWIAWLKKQGEQKSNKVEPKSKEKTKFYDSMDDLIADALIEEIENSELDDSSKHNRIYWIKSHRQKSTWSEEDEQMLHEISQCVYDNVVNIGTVNKVKYIDWLESLKERMKGE